METNHENLQKAINLTLDTIKNNPLKKSIKIKHSEITDSSTNTIIFKIIGRVSKNKELDLVQLREELFDLLGEEINNDFATDFISQNFNIQIGISEGDKFKEFDVNDNNGAKHTLKHEAGWVYLLDFWATWCKYCQEPMQENIDLMNKDTFKDKNVKIIGISCDEDSSKWKAHTAEKKWDNIQHYVRADVRAHLGIKSIPCILIVDKKGNVAYYGHPANIKLEETLINLCEEKKVVSDEETGELNSWWTSCQDKVNIVGKVNEQLKSCSAANASFIVNTKYDYDEKFNRSVRSIPVFFGNISPYEYEVVEKVSGDVTKDYKLEGCKLNLTIVNIMDEDF